MKPMVKILSVIVRFFYLLISLSLGLFGLWLGIQSKPQGTINASWYVLHSSNAITRLSLLNYNNPFLLFSGIFLMFMGFVMILHVLAFNLMNKFFYDGYSPGVSSYRKYGLNMSFLRDLVFSEVERRNNDEDVVMLVASSIFSPFYYSFVAFLFTILTVLFINWELALCLLILICAYFAFSKTARKLNEKYSFIESKERRMIKDKKRAKQVYKELWLDKLEIKDLKDLCNECGLENPDKYDCDQISGEIVHKEATRSDYEDLIVESLHSSQIIDYLKTHNIEPKAVICNTDSKM